MNHANQEYRVQKVKVTETSSRLGRDSDPPTRRAQPRRDKTVEEPDQMKDRYSNHCVKKRGYEGWVSVESGEDDAVSAAGCCIAVAGTREEQTNFPKSDLNHRKLIA